MTKHPNIYFIFFDTPRPDFTWIQPEFKKFGDQNFTFTHAYGSGTATWYSTFSLYHALPGFLTYESIPKKIGEDYYGSVFLKILQKLGYQINTYGTYWGCVSHPEKSESKSWENFLTSFFGWKSRLIERYSDEKYDAQVDSLFDSNEDRVTIQELDKILREKVKTPESHFNILNLYNVHDPYKWGEVSQGILTDDFSNPTHTKNRYFNSVVAANKHFSDLLNIISKLTGYENAIIVLFSDHGEMLYEKGGESRHGGIPYQEKINTVLSFQFGEHSNYSRNSHHDSLGSISDIFPTLFDYLEITPKLPKSWITGESLLSSTRKSVLVTRSNMYDPTREFVFLNTHKKVWMHIDDLDFYHSRTLSLSKITDLHDKDLQSKQEFCNHKTADECKGLLINEFPEAINELYPDLNLFGKPDLQQKNRMPASVLNFKKVKPPGIHE